MQKTTLHVRAKSYLTLRIQFIIVVPLISKYTLRYAHNSRCSYSPTEFIDPDRVSYATTLRTLVQTRKLKRFIAFHRHITLSVELGSLSPVLVGATMKGSELSRGQRTYQITGDMKLTEDSQGQIVLQPAGASKKID